MLNDNEPLIPVNNNFPDPTLPDFMVGYGVQRYHKAEEGVVNASHEKCTHWYIDGAEHSDRAAEWSDSRIDNMKDLMAKYGIKPIYHGNFKVPIASDVPEIRKKGVGYVYSEIDVAAKLGAPLILHAGGIVEPRDVKGSKERALNGYIDSLKDLSAYAEEKGVVLWLENLCNYKKFHPFYYIFTNLAEYERVFSEIKSENVKMIFDVCHETVGGGDPIEVFDRLKDKIVSFSFSDTDGVRDSHWPLGKGVVNYRSLLNAIQSADWRGVVSFETRGGVLYQNVEYLNQLINDISRDRAPESSLEEKQA